MGKTRVAQIIRESVGATKSTNRSTDLVALTQQYHSFCKKLRVLIQSLQAHHSSLLQIDVTRTNVARQFADFSKKTPLYEAVGLEATQERPDVMSFISIQESLSTKAKGYAGKYKQFVIEYVVEWERVITSRINAGLRKAEDLRRDLDHYQAKVEALRLQANQAMTKGKTIKAESAEKLSRNEEKLIQARQNYGKVATDLCILIEEVTERSWRDLHPILIKCAQFDMTLSNEEAKHFASLNKVVDQLKQVAVSHQLSPQPRLKDLGNLQPELLSTRPGGVQTYDPSNAIEAGGAPPIANALPMSTSGQPGSPYPMASASIMGGSVPPMGSYQSERMALPPGSVGAQGMGGFPVQIPASTNEYGPPPPRPIDPSAARPSEGSVSRRSSFGSYGSSNYNAVGSAPTSGNYEPPTTLQMVSISQAAAPAPTLEDVYSADYAPPDTSSSAPPPAAPPPPPPAAAAPAAPPPPPPAGPPPPPPSYGMGSGSSGSYQPPYQPPYPPPPYAATSPTSLSGRDPPSFQRPAHPWSTDPGNGPDNPFPNYNQPDPQSTWNQNRRQPDPPY